MACAWISVSIRHSYEIEPGDHVVQPKIMHLHIKLKIPNVTLYYYIFELILILFSDHDYDVTPSTSSNYCKTVSSDIETPNMIIEESEKATGSKLGNDCVDEGTAQNEDSDEEPESTITLNGLVIKYKNDLLNNCVHDAIKKMSRVKYKCMDVYRDYLAFGTSSGGIYLFRLDSYEQSSCNLIAMIPCDGGSVEVIRFLPNLENQDLLVAIGTSRGSLVIFRLTRLTRDHEPFCNEIYKAQAFTANSAIKSIDVDQSYLVDMNYKLEGIYICDTSNRIYILHYDSIVKSSRRSNAKHQPTLVLSVNDSRINQISIYKQILLISTIENSRLFYESSCQLFTIGTIRRKEGYYGACFYTPTNLNQGHTNLIGMSTTSLSSESQEPFMCFIARQNFRLWHVNHERKVLFTHKFEPCLRGRYTLPIELINEICTNYLDEDDPSEMVSTLKEARRIGDTIGSPSVDHFENLTPIYTKTLGNLLLSYSKREIFVVNPIEADLIAWIQVGEKENIIQVANCDNELFVWTDNDRFNGNKGTDPTSAINHDQTKFKLTRYILLAPTQMILEFHRMQRHYSLIAFVQLFAKQFKELMAIPLSNKHTIITTEGGLLRNVLLSSWQATTSQGTGLISQLMNFKKFSKIIEQILAESRQLKDSFHDLASSQLYLLTSKENIERLYSEPYTSLITLQVSIASLHTEHVIHFDQETIDHHKQMNLSQTLLTLQESKQRLALSNNQLQQIEPQPISLQEKFQLNKEMTGNKKNNTLKQQSRETLYRSVSQNCILLNGTTGPLIDMSKLQASNSSHSRRNRFRNEVVAENAKVIVERHSLASKKRNTANALANDDNQIAEEQLDHDDCDIADTSQITTTTNTNTNTNTLARPFFSPKGAIEKHRFEHSGFMLNGSSSFVASSSSATTSNWLNQEHYSANFDADKEKKLNEAKRLAKLMEDSLRCSKCRWPRERVHCNSLNSSQMIQLRWIESNLLDEFEKNLAQIEHRSFEHGLWSLFLRCLIEKNDFEAYITACMMLDDVRLLDYDLLQAKLECMDRDLCDRILKVMNSKLEKKQKYLNGSITVAAPTTKTTTKANRSKPMLFCFNCETNYEQAENGNQNQCLMDDLYEELELNHQMDDEFSFNLVNLFEQVFMNRFNDLQIIIHLLLDYPNLINFSKIPPSFYLKVIATATLIAKQSPISKARLSQLSQKRRQRT